MAERPSMTPKQAIYDTLERMVRVETILIGVPGTDDTGLCGKVAKNESDLDATRKKVGHLEVRFWLLIGLLAGSGILGGIGLAQILAP